MHRKITAEEPHKLSGPVQYRNCQEYGDIRSYCKLPIVCGELYSTKECNRNKSDPSLKKCSNRDRNPTAIYKTCPVYANGSETYKATKYTK